MTLVAASTSCQDYTNLFQLEVQQDNEYIFALGTDGDGTPGSGECRRTHEPQGRTVADYGETHHYALTWSSSDAVRMYYDGDEVWQMEVSPSTFSDIAAIGDFWMGAEPTSTGTTIPYRGDLGFVRLYDRALSASNIACLATEG